MSSASNDIKLADCEFTNAQGITIKRTEKLVEGHVRTAPRKEDVMMLCIAGSEIEESLGI